MSYSMSDYLETQIKTHLFRTGSWTKPAALHVHLLKTLPSDDAGTGAAAITMTGYSPIQRDPLDANWTTTVDNAADLDYGTLTGTGERVIGWAIGDSATLGTMNWLVWGAMAKNWVRGSIDAGTDTIYIYGHGFSNGDRVFLRDIQTTTGPDQQTEYYVVGATADSIQISLTSGGAAVSLTNDGSCEVGESFARDISDGDPVKIAAGALDVFFD